MPTTTNSLRFLSRNRDHWFEDLQASLDVALGDRPLSDSVNALPILFSLSEDVWPGEQLDAILKEFGPAVFGIVIRFHLEARTSLMNASEVLSRGQELAARGVTFRDLRWPASVMHDAYLSHAAPADPALEARLAKAIKRWTARYANLAA